MSSFFLSLKELTFNNSSFMRKAVAYILHDIEKNEMLKKKIFIEKKTIDEIIDSNEIALMTLFQHNNLSIPQTGLSKNNCFYRN